MRVFATSACCYPSPHPPNPHGLHRPLPPPPTFPPHPTPSCRRSFEERQLLQQARLGDVSVLRKWFDEFYEPADQNLVALRRKVWERQQQYNLQMGIHHQLRFRAHVLPARQSSPRDVPEPPKRHFEWESEDLPYGTAVRVLRNGNVAHARTKFSVARVRQATPGEGGIRVALRVETGFAMEGDRKLEQDTEW